MAHTPIHPGEHLSEELRELDISAAELARQIDVPVNRVTGIIDRLTHWSGPPLPLPTIHQAIAFPLPWLCSSVS